MSSLVSIVLPTYNGSRYLGQSIQSCLEQTYPHWELIIVDDASTDETPEIVASFQDSRIRSIRNPQNLRLPASLNRGFSEAKGEFFTWTSDDNLYEPHALQTLVDAIGEGHDFVYADQIVIDEEGKETGVFRVESPARLFDENVINACFLYRRELHAALGGYDISRFLVEDWHFWVRAAERFKLAPVPGLLYRYRKHAASLSSTRQSEVVSQSIGLKVEYGLPRLPKAEQPKKLMSLADLAATVGNSSLRRQLAWRALRLAPGQNWKWTLKHLLNLPTGYGERG